LLTAIQVSHFLLLDKRQPRLAAAAAAAGSSSQEEDLRIDDWWVEAIQCTFFTACLKM
jgi:hypothetical protein